MRIYVTDHHCTHDWNGVHLEATVEFWPEHTNDIYEYEKLMRDCGCGAFEMDNFRKIFNIKPHESTLPSIKKVHFNPPGTIVLWDDGTKTVVKCQDGDTYSKETGLALCMAKKAMGNSSRQFNDIFKKWIPEEKKEKEKPKKEEHKMADGWEVCCETCARYDYPAWDDACITCAGHTHWEHK